MCPFTHHLERRSWNRRHTESTRHHERTFPPIVPVQARTVTMELQKALVRVHDGTMRREPLDCGPFLALDGSLQRKGSTALLGLLAEVDQAAAPNDRHKKHPRRIWRDQHIKV
jgi:hypothetical protein